jgi:hypothetical protein
MNIKVTFEKETAWLKRLAWKLRCAWENNTRYRRIYFCWGNGYGHTYVVNLRTVPGFSAEYDTIAFNFDSPREAQQAAGRANLALSRRAPRLLHKDAELPGVGFQYSEPNPKRKEAIDKALELARKYGGIDGDHHKAWVIDQMVRALTGPGYEKFVAGAKAGEDGPDTYEWNEGIAP